MELLNIKKYYIKAISEILTGLDTDTLKSLYIVLDNMRERSASRGILQRKDHSTNKADQ